MIEQETQTEPEPKIKKITKCKTPEYQRNYYKTKYTDYHRERYQKKKELLKQKYEQDKKMRKEFYQQNKEIWSKRYQQNKLNKLNQLNQLNQLQETE